MKLKKRLIFKLFSSYLFLILITIGFTTLYFFHSYKIFFIQQIKEGLEDKAHLIQNEIYELLIKHDMNSIDSFCKKTAKISSTRITIVLPDGKVIGDSIENINLMENHSNRPEIISAEKGTIGNSIHFSKTLKKNMMYVGVPLKQENIVIGIVRTSLSIDSIDSRLKYAFIHISFGIIIIVILSIFLSFIVSRHITKPIEKLKQGVKIFLEKDMNYRFKAPDSEEIASLVKIINNIADQLDERMKTIIEQRNKIETVLLNMIEGVIALDQNEKIISVNKAASSIFSLKESSWKNKTIQEAIRNTRIQKLIKSGYENKYIEDDIVFYNDNIEQILHVRSTPLIDSQGIQNGILIVITDVTQIRKLENMRRDFASNASHELKTPLTAIKGFVETLLDGAIENKDESKRFLKIIAKHVLRLETLIDDLMTLAKIERLNSKDDVNFEKGFIKDIIKTTANICKEKLSSKNITLKIQCDENISVLMNSILLEQAFINLLDNAIKYSHENSIIEIEADYNDNKAAIHFKDHGIGISESHIEHLFERFYRVDKSRSRLQGGTGLGLAIVKHIINLHKGNVSIKSVLCKGSIFSIYLPTQFK